jgi:iron complex transport system substrate-binding protein
LKPNITEIVFALGQGNQLVGVTRFCDHPPEAKKIVAVADYINIHVEKVLAQRPDLILASTENSSRKEVEFLKAHGISVELLAFATLQDIRDSVRRLGALLGKNPQAQDLLKQMDQGFLELKNKSEQLTPTRALFLVGYDPLVVVGGNNFIGEIFPYLGLTNVAVQSRMPYPVYSVEQLIQASPDVIVDLAMGSEATAAKKNRRMTWWKKFPSLPAVQKNQIYNFEIEKIRAIPQLPRALEELFSLIHATSFSNPSS